MTTTKYIAASSREEFCELVDTFKAEVLAEFCGQSIDDSRPSIGRIGVTIAWDPHSSPYETAAYISCCYVG